MNTLKRFAPQVPFRLASLFAVWVPLVLMSGCTSLPSQDAMQSFVYNVFHGWQQNRCVHSAGDTSPLGPCYRSVADYEDYKKARESLNKDPDKCIEKTNTPAAAKTCPPNGSPGH